MKSAFAFLVCVFGLLVSSMAVAQPAVMPKELEHVGVAEHLDSDLPLDTHFKDEEGRAVTFGDFANGKKPHMLVFAYHSCPVLCSMVLKAATKGLKGIPWTIGKEFDVIVVSIDPNDTPEATNRRRQMMLADYGKPEATSGLHFLTGDRANIDRLAAAAGVSFEYDAEQKQYGHPAVVMLLKPHGQLARYLYGLEFPPNDFRVGLLEASEGRSISTIEQLILYCYHYDPKGGRYVLVAWRVMRIGGGACGAVLLSVLAYLWSRERRRSREGGDKNDKNPRSAALQPASSETV
ncbi:MAG: SCO family protein [Polyangiaceae bacterium]